MNNTFENKICYYFDKLLDTVSLNKREKKQLILVELYLPKINGAALQASVSNLIHLLNIEYMLFGEWGECGLVVFLDDNLKEVCRLAYEDSDSTHSWFVEE